MQTSWLRSAIIVNEQRFNDKVFSSLGALGEKHGPILQHQLDAINMDTNNVEARSAFESRFRVLLDEQFAKENLSANYEFGFVNSRNEIIAGQEVDLGSDGCSSYPYLCSYQLAVNFPQKEAALLGELGKTLAPTIAFVLILMGSFGFVIIMLARQKKISEIKNDFINNLTHELKTPLASISLASSVLKKERSKLSDDKENEYLEVINQESGRLGRQIDKVLQIAQVDSGNFSLEKKWVNIHDVIRKVTAAFEPLLLEKNGKIELELNATKPMLRADEMHVTNIIYNLVDNAIKYSPVDPEVRLLTKTQEDGLSITVRDKGIGIKKEAQEMIFDKFYRERAGDVHDTKGFGLGLSYVKRIVDEHKGKISMSSELNMGTEFQLYLPA